MTQVVKGPSILVALLLLVGAASVQAQTPAPDRDGVRRAVLDYVEGFYEGDTTKLVRSVSPSVYKYGYSKRDEGYVGSQMPFSGFMSYANGVRDGRNRTPASAPKEITLFDVQDQTASAKLTAWWGIDYLLLARQNGRWMITHVLWQSPPPASPAPTVPGAAQRVSLPQFQQLRWLSGTWRGSGGAYAAFFEEYRVINDSTIAMWAYADSTFRVATDSSVIEWRAGIVHKRSARSAYVATRLTDESVQFMRADASSGGFTWTLTSADQWIASLHPATPAGSETVYVMRRVQRAR